jgi:putative endonuclease
VKFRWSIEFQDLQDAIRVERQVKKWSRKKKEALMRGDFDELHVLSKSVKGD